MDQTKSLARWLFFTAFMVFAMAVIGAITRLTESGLSIAEWKPLIGWIPPLNETGWQRVFTLYKDTPEFQQKNNWMGLADFQKIFFWEWLHRLWGRMIGLIYALPLLYFWVRGKIPPGYKKPLLFILLLGFTQGLMGWYMVMSGLADIPTVSHFRLAAHLLLAFVIYALLLDTAFQVLSPRGEDLGEGDKNKTGRETLSPSPLPSPQGEREGVYHGWIALALLVITIAWGAFTAGLDGGLVYNSWPKMDAHWIPPEATGLSSILHDPAAVQFAHRWLAVFTGLIVLWFSARIKSTALAIMIFFQIALGIATVMTQVMILLAALHQAGAMILIGIMVYELRRRRLK